MSERAAVARLDAGRVATGAVLGRGGQGVVRAVSGLMINQSWPVVYKRYAGHAVAQLDEAALEAMVALFDELDGDAARWLGEHTAWPAALVVENGSTCGVLMRQVPEAYYRRFDFGSASEPRPAGFEFLLNSPAYLALAGLAVSTRQRMGLLWELALTLDRLHSVEIRVGDLSPKNVLFALEPRPSCFLLDCDGMRLRGRDVLPQVETPSWELPAGEPVATAAGDAYKYGLMVIRLMAGDQETRDTGPISAVSRELGRLAADSQSPDPDLRPSPSQWATAFEHALAYGVSAVPARRPAPAARTGRVHPERRTERERRGGDNALVTVVGLAVLLGVLLLLVGLVVI